MGKGRDEGNEIHVTNIEAIRSNTTNAVNDFMRHWIPVPTFTEQCIVMNQRQLRDAMGLRATIESGDPWPDAEQLLLKEGYRWHRLGSSRVMFLAESDASLVDDGWTEAEELDDDR